MVNFEIQIIPISVSTEAGTLTNPETKQSEPAVVQTLMTTSGPLQIVFPPSSIDTIIKGLEEAREEAKKIPSSDLVVANNEQDIQNAAKALEVVESGGR